MLYGISGYRHGVLGVASSLYIDQDGLAIHLPARVICRGLCLMVLPLLSMNGRRRSEGKRLTLAERGAMANHDQRSSSSRISLPRTKLQSTPYADKRRL